MRTLEEFLKEQLKNPKFRDAYEAIQPEMAIIKAMVEARSSLNLTRRELAKRARINWRDYCKLENGTRNPSINLLKRLADGMDMVLKIEFVPKQKA